MAMITCSRCDRRIHHTARVCPRCGTAQVRRSNDTTEATIDLNDAPETKEMIQRWRLAAAILFGLVISCIIAFNRPRFFTPLFPWIYFIFVPLLIATVIVFVTAMKKEHRLNNRSETLSTELPAGALRTKYLVLILSVLVIVFLGCILWYSSYGYAYRQYFFHSKAQLMLDFNQLEPMTQADTKTAFQFDWYCRKEINQLGDSYCSAELVKWNNIPAMQVLFWYRNNIVTQAKIDVPPWHHDELTRYIFSIYGPPQSYSARLNLRNILAGTSAAIKGNRGSTVIKEVNDLGVWQMDTGALLIVNLKKELNPLLWNTVLWISPDIVRQKRDNLN